jgi:hypothetical protein
MTLVHPLACRLASFPVHLWNGAVSRYPPCCVLAFSLVSVVTDRPPEVLGGRRDRGGHVPCGVLHLPHDSPVAVRVRNRAWARLGPERVTRPLPAHRGGR